MVFGSPLFFLHSGPSIDSALHQRVIAADRKALYATFALDELQTYGRNFTNQYANAWGGALAYLDLFSDSELKSGNRQVVTAHINAENTLTYRIAFR